MELQPAYSFLRDGALIQHDLDKFGGTSEPHKLMYIGRE